MEENKLRIIKIIDDTTLIGKGGLNEGIVTDQRFNIVGKTDGDEIKDPESGESLGFLGRKKGTVIAANVHEKFTVYKSEFVPSHPMPDVLKGFGMNSTVPAHYERLAVDLDQVSSFETDEVIKIGDYLEPVNSLNFDDED